MTNPAKTPREILDSFTAAGDICESLNAPWLDGGYAYASNRHWMVRMSAATPDFANLPVFKKGMHPSNAAVMFDRAPWCRLQAMPAIAEPTSCRHCAGSGLCTESTCPNCQGAGEFTHHGHFHDCEICNGEGHICKPPAPGGVNTVRCRECYGTGYLISGNLDNCIVEIDNTWAQGGYLAQISKLPGVLFATNEDPTKTCAFRFDGGEGLLMPCRAPRAHTIDSGGAA